MARDRHTRKDSHTYDAGGKGQWILERLEDRAARRDELLEAADLEHLRNIRFVLGQLQHDGAVIHQAGWYAATDAGREILTRLRSGEDVTLVNTAGVAATLPRPNARIFSRSAAANQVGGAAR